MTDYVPGPWHSSKTSVVCFYGTRRIQVATTRQPLFTPEAQAANARLIAAAPDLLASLERLVTLMNIVGDEPFRNGVTDSTGSMDEGIVIASKWLHEARAAIAKATGQ